jgi:RHS repeat-associated protein
MRGPLVGRRPGRLFILSVLSSSLLLVAVLGPSTASAAECTDTWKGPAEGNWATASNWSTSKVPAATDVACIGSGKAVIVNSAAQVAGAVQGEGLLSLQAGSLSLASTEVGSSINSLFMLGGTLQGSGTLTVEKTLSLKSESWMAGAGATIVAPGATVSATLGGALYLQGRHLINEGTFEQASGGIRLSEGAELVNTGTFNANSTSAPAMLGGAIVNSGIFQKTSGKEVTEVSTRIENSGTVSSKEGTLKFVSGGSSIGSAQWESSSGGHHLNLGGGNFSLKGGTLIGPILIRGWIFKGAPPLPVVSAEGIVGTGADLEVEAGTLNVPSGSFAARELLMKENANVSGAGTLTINKSFAWTGEGEMTGAGKTVIGSGATGSLNQIGQGFLRAGRQFINEGTFTMANGGIYQYENTLMVNSGTFIANSLRPVSIAYAGAGARFVNSGLIEKSAGAALTEIEPPSENSGGLRVLSGQLRFTRPKQVQASAATPHRSKCADPVDCATGNFTESQTDFAIGGRGVGLDLTHTYSAQSAVAGNLGSFGYGWTNSFGDKLTSEESGAKQTLTEASGGTVTFTKSGAAWLAPSWSPVVLTGSTESGFTLTLRGQTKEKFNGSGRLESVTDRDGNETTLAYNGSGKFETITDPTGRKITLTYNAEGLVERAKDPMGHEVKYAYESKQLKSVTLPGEASASWQFKYDGSHRMTSFTDGRGGKTTNEYDSSNRVIAQTDPMERKTTFAYEGFHTTITNKATGAVTDEWFNSNNQPMSITRGYGTASATTETFTYTAAGLLASKTDGNGHPTNYEYDANGNRIKETDPEGDETSWTFNGSHQVLTATTPNGERTTIARNANGDPETVSRPAPESKTQTVSFAYGPHGEVETMTDPLGHVWSFEYDKYGDRIASIDPEGDKQTWTYDEDSRAISAVSPRGNEEGAEAANFTTSIERDAQGRPIKITDPLGHETKTAYDADGNVESVTDPNGRKTKFTYDPDNELTKVEHANKAVEETGYDGAGAVTSQTDGNKDKTTYVRNILGEPIETIDPLERRTIRTYNPAGNLATRKDTDGRTTTYSYDKADRLREVSYSDGITPKVTFSYDKDGNLTGMVDGTGESTYEYDQLDRLTHSKNGNAETVSWTYDVGDEPVCLTYPNGKSISRTYDNAGRLESVTDWLGHTTTFAYNKDSAPTLTTFPVGTTDSDEYAYDRADRIASVTMRAGAETLASVAYSRDPAGQLESLISKGLPGGETESFSYDENERLTKAGGAEYGYDAANNITKAPGTTNAYDKASQLESATGAAFSFDKEGERTKRTPSSGPATTYKYDQAEDLTAIERPEEGETPAIAEAFSYDGTGLMASRTVGLTTNRLVWDLSEAPEVLLSDGEDSYLYGPGGLTFEQISSEEVPTCLHHDQLGSTRVLTNSSGESAATFTYGPYGALTGKTGTATTALGYAGQYTLGQSGLQYLRARFYDPTTAQFLTLDPGVGATRAPYFYAGDNPANRRDRTGQAEEGIEGCFGCLPLLPTQEQGERALEGLGEIGNEIGDFVGGLFGGGSSSTPAPAIGVEGGGGWPLAGAVATIEATLNEADGETSDDVPCETSAEIGDRQQQRDEDRQFVEKEGHSKGTNPSGSLWPPSGSRIAKVIAVIGRLIGQGHH